jgi:hypothetical protein
MPPRISPWLYRIFLCDIMMVTSNAAAGHRPAPGPLTRGRSHRTALRHRFIDNTNHIQAAIVGIQVPRRTSSNAPERNDVPDRRARSRRPVSFEITQIFGFNPPVDGLSSRFPFAV